MSDHGSKSNSKSNLMQHQEDMVDRLAKIEFANPVCADCPNERPRWASFLKDKQEEEDNEDQQQENDEQLVLRVQGHLSVMVCDDCAIKHHNELGAKRCRIKCLECFHEWTHQEADIVLNSGNTLVNSLYESNLQSMGDFDKDVVVDDDNTEVEDNRRSKFIKNKYKKYKYRNNQALQNALERLQNHNSNPQPKKHRAWSCSDSNTHKAGSSPKSKTSFLSSLLLVRSSSHRVSRATKAMTAFSNSYSADSAPKKPDRCLSSATSSNYQPSNGVSSVTWSEGRSGYSVASDIVSDDDLGSISSWWEAEQ